MNVEQMRNEELAIELLSGDWEGHAKNLTDEAARRLRNSIPKPVVQLVSGPSSGGYTYTINGREFWTDLDGCDAEFWGAIGVQGVAP